MKGLQNLGDEISDAKVNHIEPSSFEVEVVYKGSTRDHFSFYIDSDDTLHLVDFSFDRELCDVGVKPSGEAMVNIDHCADLLAKHWKDQGNANEEMRPKDKEFADAQQADRLEKHPERDKIKQIQALMQSIKEQTHNVVVPTGQARKALGVLQDRLKGHFSPLGTDTFAFGDERAKKAAEMLLAKSGIEAEGTLAEGRLQDVEALLMMLEPGDVVSGGGYEFTKMKGKSFKSRAGLSHAQKVASMIGGFNDLKVIKADGQEIDLMGALGENEEEYLAKRDAAIKKAMGKDEVSEAPAGMYYIKVSVRDARKALAILDDMYRNDVQINGSDTYYFADEDIAYGAYEDLEGSGIEITDTNLEEYMEENEVPADVEPAPQPDGDDMDVGHTDDEPDMLKQHAYDIATYAAKLYKQLDKYDDMGGEVDFPNWWQEKVILAREFISKAAHYLEFEEKQPAIDQLALENFRGKVNEYVGADEDIIEIIRDKAADSGFSEEEEVGEIIEFLQGLSFDDNGNLDGGHISETNVEEGASTEEKRIAQMAAKKIAKYRSVSFEEGIVDLIRAANELQGVYEGVPDHKSSEVQANCNSKYVYALARCAHEKGYKDVRDLLSDASDALESHEDAAINEQDAEKAMQADYDKVMAAIEKNPTDLERAEKLVAAYRKKYNLQEAGTYCGNCGKTHPKSQSC